MATKSKGKSAKAALAKAVKAGDITAALMAVSAPATAADSMNSAILQCIVAAFDKQGLNHISSLAAKIVWMDIPITVIVKLGNGVTACLAGKGIQVPALAVAFGDLKDSNQVTVVSDLVAAIGQLAG